jgi:hypothetical protein
LGDLKAWSRPGGLTVNTFRVNISTVVFAGFWALFPLLMVLFTGSDQWKSFEIAGDQFHEKLPRTAEEYN